MKVLSRHLLVLFGYAFLAVLYTYPTILHFGTRYIGHSGGDVGLTLRDMWYFRHALTQLHVNPLWTDLEYWPHGGNLILTNYCLFNDVQAFFLAPLIGMPATWNFCYLSALALSGYGVYLLLRDWSYASDEAFAAGALFSFCPTAAMQLEHGRGLEVACWTAIPFFFWFLCRAVRDRRARDAFGAALCLTWVWSYNNYYLILCALFIPFFYLFGELRVAVKTSPIILTSSRRVMLRILDGLLAAGFASILCLLSTQGVREFHGHGSATELILHVMPYVSFWCVVGLRLLLSRSFSWEFDRQALSARALYPYLATIGFYAAINLPFIVAVGFFMHSGDFATMSRSWRGGGNPCDPLWLLLPNIFNPMWKEGLAKILSALPFGPPQLATLGLIPVATVAWWWYSTARRDKWTSLWLASLVFSFILVLGPWLKILGVHTYLPLPFYFLHLLPIYSNMPTGQSANVLAAFFLSLLFAAALQQIKRRLPARAAARASLVILALLAFEFAPGARETFALQFPPIMARFQAHPYGAYLPVPLGINFHLIANPGPLGVEWLEPQHQIAIQKPRVGGYLTRVARRVYRITLRDPFIQALFSGQAGGEIESMLNDCARVSRYLRDTRLKYVFVNEALVPAALSQTIRRWPLRQIDQEGPIKLYSVDVCLPPPDSKRKLR